MVSSQGKIPLPYDVEGIGHDAARRSAARPGQLIHPTQRSCRRHASVFRQAGRWLRRGDRSAVALELGIIAIPFFTMLLGVMELSFDLYVQAALDNAVETAARSVQVGAAVGTASETSSAFLAASVCPNLGGLLDCAMLTVGVAPVPSGFNYYSLPVQNQLTQAEANNGTGICTGVAGQMMVLKAWYDGPTFVGLLVPSFTTTYNDQVVHVTTASAGFVDEYFAGGQNTGGACSNL
jgi:pilus assembly protein Flp/PilA